MKRKIKALKEQVILDDKLVIYQGQERGVAAELVLSVNNDQTTKSPSVQVGW